MTFKWYISISFLYISINLILSTDFLIIQILFFCNLFKIYRIHLFHSMKKYTSITFEQWKRIWYWENIPRMYHTVYSYSVANIGLTIIFLIRTSNPHFMWCKRRKIDYCEKIPRKLDCLSYRKSFIYVVNLSI